MKKADMHHAHPPLSLDWVFPQSPNQRPVTSEPTTFSLRARGPRVTATAPERTSSITP